MATISIENLSVTYTNSKRGQTVAINDLNAEFPSGEISVVMGCSGCGKTTLLRSILGFVEYEGDIFQDGIDIADIPVNERGFSHVSQEYVLYPKMTIFDNIAFPLKNMKASSEEIVERVNAVADILGLKHCLTRKPKHLSGGQQQRVALGRALVKHPKLCLLDEPLSNLDAPSRLQTRKYIKDIIKSFGVTAIYVTHDFDEGMALADKLFIMNEGKIVCSGNPQKVFHSGNDVVEALKASSTSIE